ncbi:MAG: hypothetical protein ACRD68_04960 [Pyrinomonadaceae bacterium]
MATQSQQNVLYFFAPMVVVALLLLSGCGMSPGDETDRANKLVDEGNAEVEAGRKFAEEGMVKYMLAFNFDEKTGTAADWEEIKQPAREASELLEKAATSFSKAADKFEEAGRLNVDDKFKQYLIIKAQSFRKNVEQMRVTREIPESLLNASVKDTDALLARIEDVNRRSQELSKESERLEAEAEKIQKENAGRFKS